MLNNYPEILTPRDIMQILQLSKNTVYSMLNNSTLPAYRIGIGKICRINKADLIDYLQKENEYW